MLHHFYRLRLSMLDNLLELRWQQRMHQEKAFEMQEGLPWSRKNGTASR